MVNAHWASVAIDAVVNSAGELTGFAKITRDAKPHLAERVAFDEQQDECRLIVEAAPNGMMIIDPAGIITLANAQVEAIFGYPSGSLVGQSVDVLVPDEFRPGHASKRESFAGESAPRAMAAQRQLLGRRLDGGAVPIEIMLNPATIGVGRVVVVSVVDVTQRQHAEEQLRVNTAQLREKNRMLAMAEQMSHIGHWRLDLKSNQVFWSDEMYRTFDLPNTFRPTLENSMAAYHPDDREHARAVIRLGATKGVPYTRESRVVRPDGTIRQIITKGQPEYASDGTLIALFGVFQDITETKETERERARLFEHVNVLAEDLRATGARDRATAERLISANQFMNMAEEMAHYGHWRIDLLSRAVYWSEEVCRIHGLPTTHQPTLETSIAAYDRAGPDVAEIVRRASIDGKPFTYESRILCPDQSLRDVRCLGRGEFSAEGTLVALVGIFKDITERKDAERARDQLTERVSLATKTGQVGVWEWVIDTGVMTWFTHMFALHGLDPSTAVPSYQLWKSALHAGDRESAVRAIDDALAGREPFDTEFRVVWPNGEVHSIRAQATVLRNTAHEPVRMVGINWDISDVRSLADQMHEEKEGLRQAERERLYEHERRWSRTFQQAVLPIGLPHVVGCTFDAVYEPGSSNAQVGGDWYDAVHLSDGRVLVSIGDVSGSGLQAAVVVGVARQIIRGISQLHADPMVVLDAADRALCLEYPGVYVSAWVGLIDLVTSTITYASAGHPPPLLVSQNGATRELDDATTMLIGLRKGHRGQASAVKITQGDALVLYTDGITEASHDVIAGTQSLHEAAVIFAASGCRQPAESIKRRLIPDGSSDDVALLIVRTDSREAERHIERWQFDVRDGDAAGNARAKFVTSLRQRAFTPDACANAELVFGELIGNVLRHVNHSGNVEVAVNHGGSDSVLHVMDHGRGFNHISRLPRDPYAEDGRGLFLIAALTEDFTVSERPDGGSHARAVLVRDAA